MKTPERYQSVKRIFVAACELKSAERTAYLDRECSDDPELRAEIEQLLAAHEDRQAGFGTVSPAGEKNESRESPEDRKAAGLPNRIGPYTICGLLGEGGMGVVYQAVQENPKRTVALKVLRPGFMSRSLLRRFEFEAEVLGRLQHPGIAQIFEAGTAPTDHGTQPYFAMELVEGRPLNLYTQSHQLGMKVRLELFVRICRAVHHAHLKGVIHRDLKPSNILVTEAGDPKILDFGIARATDSDLQTTTLKTDVGQLIGTIPYMSPEQVAGRGADLDNRSDVYSLGVIAYELLSGRLPHDLAGRSIPEALRMIQEDEPTALNRTLRGDVETIILKALEKDPDRRYDSAAALAEDIDRHLLHQPIQAHPPSATYQLRKLIARYKALSAMVGLLVISISAFGIWMSVLYRHADHLRLEAEREGAKATEVQEFLQDMLASIDPIIAQGRDTTILRELLDRAAAKVSEELTRQPQVEAELRSTIGATYKKLGLFDPAEVHLREVEAIYTREFGDEHRDTLRSRTELANLLLIPGNFAEAEILVRPTLELQRTLFGRVDSDTLRSMDVLSRVLLRRGRHAEAEQLGRQSLDIRRGLHGKEHLETLKSMTILSAVRYAQGDLEEAETLRRQTMEIRRRILGEAHSATLVSMNNLGNVLRAQHKYTEAEQVHRQTLQIRRRVHGEAHPVTLNSMNNLANVLLVQVKYTEAEQLHRQTLQIRRRVLAEDHPDTLKSMHNLGVVLWYQDRFEEAEEMYRETLEGRRRVLTPQHPKTLRTLEDLVGVLGDQGKLDDARPLLIELLAQHKRAAEDVDADSNAKSDYAWVLLTCKPVDLRDSATALRAAKRAVQMGRNRNADHLETLSLAYKETGDIDLAIVAQRKALELAPPGESLHRKEVEERLVSLYWESGDLETAEKICRDLLARRRGANLDKSYPFIDNALELLGGTLAKREKFADAEPILGECLEIRREALPENDWRIPHTKSLLGASLAGQGSFEAAEPLIINGYHEIERSPDVLREPVQEALLRIVDLYEAWGEPEKAAEYRAMLPKTDETEPAKP